MSAFCHIGLPLEGEGFLFFCDDKIDPLTE